MVRVQAAPSDASDETAEDGVSRDYYARLGRGRIPRPARPRLHQDFDTATRDVVALLRAATVHDPCDREFLELEGTLTTEGDEHPSRSAELGPFR